MDDTQAILLGVAEHGLNRLGSMFVLWNFWRRACCLGTLGSTVFEKRGVE